MYLKASTSSVKKASSHILIYPKNTAIIAHKSKNIQAKNQEKVTGNDQISRYQSINQIITQIIKLCKNIGKNSKNLYFIYQIGFSK